MAHFPSKQNRLNCGLRRLRGSMLRGLQIQTVRSALLGSHLAKDSWVMTFPVGDKGRTSLIRMEVRPEGLATLEGEIAIEGRPPARLSAFIYP